MAEERVGLVTGGGSGIGRATALALAAAGARVVVSDVNGEGAVETARLVEAAGGTAWGTVVDVTQGAAVEGLVRGTVERYGRLNWAVNNAGVGGVMAPTDQQSEAAWDAIMDVNLKGVWLCMKYEIRAMLEQGGGAIVNVASAAGLVGFRYAAPYAASKHGVVGLTRSAALEYARKGIRVNAVCPGFTETPMVAGLGETMVEATVKAIPMRRLGTPEEIAQAIVWLCSEGASFVTGHALAVDGGTVVA